MSSTQIYDRVLRGSVIYTSKVRLDEMKIEKNKLIN